MPANCDFLAIEVLDRLPASLPSDERKDSFPAEMIGARIVFIGTLQNRGVLEGGGMVIDYQPENGSEVIRLVLSLNDLGAWVEFLGSASHSPTQV